MTEAWQSFDIGDRRKRLQRDVSNISLSSSQGVVWKVALTLTGLLAITCIMGIVAWQVDESKIVKKDDPDHGNGTVKTYKIGDSYLTADNFSFTLMDANSKVRLNGQFSKMLQSESERLDCSGGRKDHLCFLWPNEKKFEMNYTVFGDVKCYSVGWEALRCADQIFRDCFELTNAHWYGGFTDWNQYWPFERTTLNLSAFVPNDYTSSMEKNGVKTVGEVNEKYFINTQGIGINVNMDIPLHISINETGDKKLCLVSKFENYPYSYKKDPKPTLGYRICMAGNVREIHNSIQGMTWVSPIGIPDKKLFKNPIWSTSAQSHKNISQTDVLGLAKNIVKYKFSHSQLEIDNKWSPNYGDLDFDQDKFPNATDMVQELNSMGFRVSVLVHPFCNIDSNSFAKASELHYLLTQYKSELPALVSWGDSSMAGVLDVSNYEAVKWFKQKLRTLQSRYEIKSFRFDGGENTPTIFDNLYDKSNSYARKWAILAYSVDENVRSQNLRVGVNSQMLPIFVRMHDKNSNWGYENGLKTLIPTALTFGILGYSFVLPDIIGGHKNNSKPDRELYIRWLQATALLPTMQFSIPPWEYDDEVVRISRTFDQLHQEYAGLIIQLAEKTVTTRQPIIRPLWWNSPDDKHAQIIDSEFLLGDGILVAPVLENGARNRDIYLPAGTWRSNINSKTTVGPMWLRKFSVRLDQLPIFTKRN